MNLNDQSILESIELILYELKPPKAVLTVGGFQGLHLEPLTFLHFI